MATDDERDTYPEREQHYFDEPLQAEGDGWLREPQHTREGCDTSGEKCGPDEYPEDPFATGNRPGTVDDLPNSFGVELPQADDEHLVEQGRTHHAGPEAGEERERDLGDREARDLWRRQRPLIEEDEHGVQLPVGMTEEEGRRVMDAMGDDEGTGASEDVAEESATGSAHADDF